VYPILTILAMACAGSEQSVVLDLAQPVSPVRVKAEQILASVQNVPPGWLVQTKVVVAVGGGLDSIHLPSWPANASAKSDEKKRSPTPVCTIGFDSSSLDQAVETSAKILGACDSTSPVHAVAKDFHEAFEKFDTRLKTLARRVDDAGSPLDVVKAKREIRGSGSTVNRWKNLLLPFLDTLRVQADSATTRRFECSLGWNDTALVMARSLADEGATAKVIDIAIVRWKNPKTLKGVSIGVSYFRHDVNNYTVSHTYDTTGKMLTSRIENNPEENGSLQPSLMVALPLCAWQVGKQDWEAGLAFGYTPKIDLSNVRIFDASLSAGVFVGSHPFGINLSLGTTPLVHLKGGFKTGQVYDGDLDAANITQNTFTFMYGGGIFWSFN
jgi:hypothetical protein